MPPNRQHFEPLVLYKLTENLICCGECAHKRVLKDLTSNTQFNHFDYAVQSGIKKYDPTPRNTVDRSDVTRALIGYLNCKIIRDHRPDKQVTFLPEGKSRYDLWRDSRKFLKSLGTFQESDLPGKSSFFEIFKTHFPGTSRAQKNPFAKCTDCFRISEILKGRRKISQESLSEFAHIPPFSTSKSAQY